jgi:hypothetical protein
MTAATVKLVNWWGGPGRRLPRFRLDGKRISLVELAKLYGLPEYAVMARVERGQHPSMWFLAARELHTARKRKRAA